jgi:hypothetical protein
MTLAEHANREGIRQHKNFHMVSSVASRDQSGVVLSYREQQALTYLRSHAGAYIPAYEIAEFIWGAGTDPQNARVIISQLRAKLGSSFVDSCSFGYRLTHSRAALVAMVCRTCGHVAVNYSEEWVCYGCVGTHAVDLEVGRAEGPGERSGQAWSEQETAFVAEHADDMSLDEMGEVLQRSGSSVRARLDQLGIEKKYTRRRR